MWHGKFSYISLIGRKFVPKLALKSGNLIVPMLSFWQYVHFDVTMVSLSERHCFCNVDSKQKSVKSLRLQGILDCGKMK